MKKICRKAKIDIWTGGPSAEAILRRDVFIFRFVKDFTGCPSVSHIVVSSKSKRRSSLIVFVMQIRDLATSAHFNIMWFDMVLIGTISCTVGVMIYVNVNPKLQCDMISLQLLLKPTYEPHCWGNKANEKAAGKMAYDVHNR